MPPVIDEDERPTSPESVTSSGSSTGRDRPPLPAIFTDNGWHILNRSILSTSNCGNPALRLFGFGPVTAEGYGIGYIIKDEGISMYVLERRLLLKDLTDVFLSLPFRCASSKHLQTRRFLDTLQSYLLDIQRILVQLHLSANQRPEPFVDHQGVLRDSKTGRPINGHRHGNSIDVASLDEDNMMSACSFLLCFCPIIGVGTEADGCVCRVQWDTRSSTAGISRCSEGRRTGRRTITRARSFLWLSTERRGFDHARRRSVGRGISGYQDIIV